MITNTEDRLRTTFASWEAFVDHVEPMCWYHGGCYWMGGSKEDAFRMARFGWREQTPKVAEMAGRVADRVVTHSALALRTEVSYDVVGAAYDPGAYMSGIPECWVAFKPVEEKGAVRIIMDGTVSAGVSKENKIALGTAVTALILALNSAGHPVTVDLFFGGSRGESCFIRLHDGALGAPLDIDRIVYGIAHPLPMRGMAHTLWGRGVTPYLRNRHPEDTKGPFDLWLGGGHLYDVYDWTDGGEEWVVEEYLKQTTA